ncbi:MAG: hypothetical protein KGJ34_01700 [Patescibacteria group bacterium]|nr:hypothetical protein [Patescibacteria group bacterium]
MDSELEELKELVRQNMKLTADTNRLVHAMRRNARLAMVVRTLYWLAIILILGASYYFYVAPYIQKFQQLVGEFQTTSSTTQTQGQNFFQSFEQAIKNHFP